MDAAFDVLLVVSCEFVGTIAFTSKGKIIKTLPNWDLKMRFFCLVENIARRIFKKIFNDPCAHGQRDENCMDECYDNDGEDCENECCK